ncbi:arylsulfatase [Gordonia mangrovi]|uniref:arylsulfatase n=1 Tax=Gordonia mangrovi TaxID=2665643 RepID=UPI00192579EE|nr:arylsulfatase [Gordonia mangrovi]UVF79364.1 arylsulfatase [Gordonia mangrovi]
MSDRDPSAYRGFQGEVGPTFASSSPWWPQRPTAPEGAPNVIVMLVDDMGFSDLACYGSEIPTPHADATAERGIRFANFHSTPMCSPTRAALMTGRNAHAAGVGFVAHVDPGFPGYASELPANQPTMAETLRDNGYSTFMVGKWHLCKEQDMSEAGSRHSWPLQRGFDQFYGFLEALTNFHQPHRLYEGNTVVDTDQFDDDYYLTDDLTDRAVRMIRETKTANPDKPFFLYYSHGAVHAPLHAKADDIARHRGNYDDGWDALRARRFERQKELGIVGEDTVLPPRNSEPGEDVRAWESLSDDEKALYPRYMEVYAAMVESVDQSLGRLRETLAELGELDNTIIVLTSDNGASREGKASGTTAYFRDGGSQTRDVDAKVIAESLERIDEIGGPTTWPHYPRGWAMACNTPFRLYKVSTVAGGHQVPMIVSWPQRLAPRAEPVRWQYSHVTDLLPTLIDWIGLAPVPDRHGLAADPMHGVSLRSVIEDPETPSEHTRQHYECMGNRAIFDGGWEALTIHTAKTPFAQDNWQLYDLAADPTQTNDLAAAEPERLEQLVRLWEQEAWDNQVYPLDEGARVKYLYRPDGEEVYSEPLSIRRGTPTLERWRSARLIAGRSFRIVPDWDPRPGDEGVLVAHGGQESGYLVYVENDLIHFVHNNCGEMRKVATRLEGRDVVIDVNAPGGGVWNVALVVDGIVRDCLQGVRQFAGFLPFNGIDVGKDTRSPVDWELSRRKGTFPFTGALHAVRYEPGELAPDAPANRLDEAVAIGLALE